MGFLLQFANIFYTSPVFRNRLAHPSSSITKIINKQWRLQIMTKLRDRMFSAFVSYVGGSGSNVGRKTSYPKTTSDFPQFLRTTPLPSTPSPNNYSSINLPFNTKHPTKFYKFYSPSYVIISSPLFTHIHEVDTDCKFIKTYPLAG
jgi:hypothetical protein